MRQFFALLAVANSEESREWPRPDLNRYALLEQGILSSLQPVQGCPGMSISRINMVFSSTAVCRYPPLWLQIGYTYTPQLLGILAPPNSAF